MTQTEPPRTSGNRFAELGVPALLLLATIGEHFHNELNVPPMVLRTLRIARVVRVLRLLQNDSAKEMVINHTHSIENYFF